MVLNLLCLSTVQHIICLDIVLHLDGNMLVHHHAQTTSAGIDAMPHLQANLEDHSAEYTGTALHLNCVVENVVQLDSRRVLLLRHWTRKIVNTVPVSLH